MAMTANQKEEAYIQSFIKMLKDLTKSGDQLNGQQLKGVEQMTKWMTQMTSNDKATKQRNKQANQIYNISKKQQQIDIEKKQLDADNIKLRHGYNLQEEKEHGEQVRRNIALRQMHENFTQGFNMLRKSLFGGFGFQAAIGTSVKKMAGLTRNFNELGIANDALAKSDKELLKADKLAKAEAALPDDHRDKKGNLDKDRRVKLADNALHLAKLENQSKLDSRNQAAKLAAPTQGKMTKPIFEKLGKLGEFLGKKAVPIGLGMGVAGVIMSIIVKAFSASPLFAAMMKMMKFMVTLILMPIGTFFGALLRPVLIMLLRKFIIPFYSHWMPVLMKVGGQLGAALSGEPLDPFNKIPPTNPEELSEMSLMEKLAAWADGWDMNNPFGLDAYADSEGNLKVAIKSGLIDSDGNPILTPEDIPKAAPDADMNKTEDQEPLDVEAELAGGDRQPDGTILLPNGDVIKDGVTYKNADDLQDGESKREDKKKETPDEELARIRKEEERVQAQLNLEMEGESQSEEDAREAEERRLRSEQQKQEWRDEQQKAQNEQNARMDKAREDEEKRLRQEENQKRLSEALSKPAASTGADRMAAQEARNAQQETVNTVNPRFAGTPSEGKLSSSQNAGMNVGKTIDKNATKKHTMGSSQAGSDILREYWASRGVTMAAEGFDGMVNKPTMFMAGEAGSEHVKVTPNGKGESGGSTITVNIQNMNAGDDDLRKLKKTILEVIQQSANNRGRI